MQRLTASLADRYRIDRELGQGGMATVYLAHDIKHDRDVAIKVLHPDLGAALGGERFLSEIRTTARLQHPHILPLLDSGGADGLLYYVMPLVTGETLRTRLERERQLPVDDAVRIAREVADALSYAHGRAVIHRDIKPENILLQDGHALVADFGIALAVQTAGGQRMTQTGLSLGTPQYMSPEQAMGERAIDARSDIYALGAVTYEMLVGEPPFTGPSVQAIVARLITEDPRGIAAQRKAVPEHVEAAVMHALEKLPADRFATAAEFGMALREGGGITPKVPKGRSTGSSKSRTPEMGGWRTIVAALTLVLGGAVIGILATRPWRTDPSSNSALTATSILPPAGGTFGEQRSLALSPDGRRLAFVFAAADGSRNLWVRSVDRLEPEAVPGSKGADAPFWSPDGRWLGFFAAGFLLVTEPNSQTRRLCPVAGATGGSWSSSGLILFNHQDGISTVPAGGGTCQLVVPRGSGPPLKGLFLPDGKRMLISRGQITDMIAASLDGKTVATLPVRTLEFAVVAPGYLLTTSLTDVRAVDAQRLNLNSLVLEGPVVRVANEVRAQAGVHSFAVSPSGVLAFLPGGQDRPYLVYDANGVLRDTVRVDGTWTVGVRPARVGPATVAIAGNTTGIWLYDLDANRGTRVLVHDSAFPTAGFAFGTTHPVFNGDGTHLAYAMRGADRCRVVDRDLRTSVERVVGKEITAFSSCDLPLDWSSDGRFLLVRRDSTLRIIPMDGIGETQSITRPGRITEGRFSPDGRSIAYASDEAAGRAEVYVQALPSGPAVRVSLEGGRWPAWTHAGRQVTYLTPDGRVQAADIAASGAPVGKPRTLFLIPTWRRSTFDDNGTGFAVVGDGERYLVRQSATGLAVAYFQHWPMIFERTDSNAGSTTRP
jgi:eukaryotic-like serine/threonine-protein kinase